MFVVTEESQGAVERNATRKQIEIRITTEYGMSNALMLLYLSKSDKPVPVFIGSNFKGNHTIYSDPAILPSLATTEDDQTIEAERGLRHGRWPVVEIIGRGFGLATIYSNDFAPDHTEAYNTRLISIFSTPQNIESRDFKAISAWAFGLHRSIDYLETETTVDPYGEFTSLRLASAGFKMYNVEPFTESEMPPVGSPIFTDHLGYHIRSGKQDITSEEWNFYMDYADRYQ
ncbi:MAG: hypothetical protein GY866_15070 [Proteobacteria bacterium]|nr:hypothetical protein [Pseudomonadota bacterium]